MFSGDIQYKCFVMIFMCRSGEPSHSGSDEDEEEILEIRFVPESGTTCKAKYL